MNIDFYALTKAFIKFVNTIIYALLEKDVDTIFCMRAITQSANVHTRTRADMFRILKVTYFALVIYY